MIIDQALKYMGDTRGEDIIHKPTAVPQSFTFNPCRSRLKPGDIMMRWDYSMNDSHRHLEWPLAGMADSAQHNVSPPGPILLLAFTRTVYKQSHLNLLPPYLLLLLLLLLSMLCCPPSSLVSMPGTSWWSSHTSCTGMT